MSADLSTVYEMRPLPDFFRGGFRRFADGGFVEDDGEYGLAFYGIGRSGAPMAIGVEPHYQQNILWSWLTEPGNWGRHERKHPGANAWHYMLRPGTTDWGGPWSGRDRHPNYLAYRAAMDAMCREASCANGDFVRFDPDDPYIKAGLVREQTTKAIVTPPKRLVCMYCDRKPVKRG